MPLSEHEQRLLEQMERALYAEDPKFATSMRNPRPAAGDRRRVALGVVACLAGIGLLIAGVALKMVPIGVVGFLAMLGGLWLAVAAFRTRPAGQSSSAGAGPAGPPQTPSPTRRRAPRQSSRGSGSLSERMEERWRRRRESGDF